MTTPSLGRILITGAASGIGFAISRRVIEAGGRLVMSDRTAADLETARDRLAAPAGMIDVVAGDLTDAHEVGLVAAAAGRIDGIVNCAGIYPVTPLM